MKIYLILSVFFCLELWGDTVYFVNGASESNVTVIADTYQKIAFETADGETVERPAPQVLRVEYADAPVVFLDGLNALSRREYANAVQWLEESLIVAQKPPVVRSWIQDYAAFYQGRAYHGLGQQTRDPDKYRMAIAAYNKALAANANTKFLLYIYYHKAQLWIVLEDINQAKAELIQLSLAVQKISAPGRWIFDLAMLQGDVAAREQSYKEAQKCYMAAQKWAIQEKRVHEMLSTVQSIGNLAILQKDFAGAEAYFQKAKQDFAEYKDVEAYVKNGLALCYFHQEKYIQARQLALEVFLKSSNAAQQPMALFILVQCYEKLKDKEKNAAFAAQMYYDLLESVDVEQTWIGQVSK